MVHYPGGGEMEISKHLLLPTSPDFRDFENFREISCQKITWPHEGICRKYVKNIYEYVGNMKEYVKNMKKYVKNMK